MDRPAISLLGIAHPRQDPAQTQHQADFAVHLARRLSPFADLAVASPARRYDDVADAILGAVESQLDGIMVVVLTDAPAPACKLALADARLPLLLANIQPERTVFDDWTDQDLGFNAGVHGAQALANALVRSAMPFSVLTGDWTSAGFASAFADWAHAAGTIRDAGWSTAPTPAAAAAASAEDPGVRMLTNAAETMLGDAHICTLQAMDWNRDALLVSPSPGFQPSPGPATTAAMSEVAKQRLRMVIGSGELIEPPELPRLGMAHLEFVPDSGMNAFLDSWLALGAPPEFVITPGDQRDRWRRLAGLLNTAEYEEI